MFQHSFMTFPMCFVLVLEVKCFHVKIIANSHAVVRNNTKRFMYILPRFPNGVCMCAKLLQSYLTLHDPVDYSPPGSSVHGILQARILEWIAIPFSRGSFCPKGRTQVSCIADRFFIFWATMEAPTYTVEFCFIFVARASIDLIYYYYSEYSIYSAL